MKLNPQTPNPAATIVQILSKETTMAMFRCNECNQEYEDYYPPDDNCLKCNKGTVWIVNGQNGLSTKAVDNYVEALWISNMTVT
jgi:Zn finger protein HypA/HybF involved in hydrogenase expression